MTRVIVDPTTEDRYDQWLTLVHSGYVVASVLEDGKEVLWAADPEPA